MKWGQGVLLIALGCVIGMLTAQLSTSVEYPLGTSRERTSPQDHIAENKIEVYQDRVVIRIDNPKWASFADTNSMDPVFDAGSNAIQITPTSPDQIEVGDIISYRHNGKVIIHRVIEKGIDGEGWYFIVKGDNNAQPDPNRVRFEDVTRVVVAVVY
jgi:hypothetical protein